ncbi:hypothetical protein B0A48_18273 [Cryoendolithus antarcticus]|uniref:non-specific serine/threonine protein kinase n=1 Tax=Cryoendolithus antarcticus TaxID=1507870 RepID=A0A1V8S9J9_9PEZI|nr:hypothetical protein B0A48_18273 [Cryoendolithus antarcticus]
MTDTQQDLRVGNKYRIGRKIGSGSFGDIYLGTNIISGEEIAIKLESVKAKHPQLEYEARVYKSLAGGVGIPFVRWFGTECDYNAMVLDLLGPSLEDLFNFCNRKFSLKTVLLLADQLISRIEYIHAKSFIHRDIKPDNFLMGIGKRGNQVNVIDFGLAKKYRDPKTHFHIPYRENKNLTGTARYASINTHLGVEQSRRDDMESLGYVMLYFCRGSLPWQGLKAATKKQKYDRIMEKKMTTPTEVLCRGFPNEFAIYLNYTRSLRFDDKPDYSYLRKIFRDLFVREGFQYDYVFDWTVYKYQKNAQAIAQQTQTGPAAAEEADEKPRRTNAATAGNSGITDKRRGPVNPRPEGTGIDGQYFPRKRGFSTSVALGARKRRGQGVVLDTIALPARNGVEERAGVVGESPSALAQSDQVAEENVDAAPELTDEDYAMLAECVDALDAAVLAEDDLEALREVLEPYAGDARVLAVREVFGEKLPVGLLMEEDEKRLYEEMYGGIEGVELGVWYEMQAAMESEGPDEGEWGAETVDEDNEGSKALETRERTTAADLCLEEDIRGVRDEDIDDEATDYAESGPDSTARAHHLTIANRASTSPSTLQLSKLTLTDPIQAIVANTSPVHLTEAAHKIFGGIGLPYSVSTPSLAKTMQQKPVALDVSQGRMTDMEGDAFMAVLMPAMYATVTNVLTETRKRLGTAWAESLVRKAEAGELRILDAGGAGVGVLAVRELLRAEWERMHEDDISLDAGTAVAEPDGKIGGSGLSAPLGNAVVLTGSDALRHRSSKLLDNTTFVPRLPDYGHTETAKQTGKFDFVIAPHTLWPIREDYVRRTHVDNMWSLVNADGGVLVMLEKGVPRGFEAIAGARQHLLNAHIATSGDEARSANNQEPEIEWEGSGPAKEAGMIIAPCTNHTACPMYSGANKGTVKGRKDICHFEQRYIRPPLLQKIVNARDKNFEDVKFSYLAVLRGQDLRSPQPETPNVFADQPAALQGAEALNLAATGYELHNRETDAAISSLSLPRQILPPLKRHGHVTMDLCTPLGTLERWVVPKSFSRQAYRDARKTQWGDLWALGAKTRVERAARGAGKHAKKEVLLDAEEGRVPRKGLSKRKIKEKRRGKERRAGRVGVLLGRDEFG